MALIRFKRGTRAELDAAATAGELNQGEPYYITDENAYALGSGPSSYIDFNVGNWDTAFGWGAGGNSWGGVHSFASDSLRLRQAVYTGSFVTNLTDNRFWVFPDIAGTVLLEENLTPDKIPAVNAWRTGYVPSVTADGKWKWINKTDLDITSVDPGRGAVAGGTTLHIYGAGFEDGMGVEIAGTSATSINAVSSTHITCQSPAGVAGDADVTLDRPDGATVTLTNGFTYEDQSDGDPDPAVSITFLNPDSGPEAGGTTTTVNGSGFQSGATVTVGGNSASATFMDSTAIEIVTPAGAPGGADVVVTNPDASTATLLNGFTYEADLNDGRG